MLRCAEVGGAVVLSFDGKKCCHHAGAYWNRVHLSNFSNLRRSNSNGTMDVAVDVLSPVAMQHAKKVTVLEHRSEPMCCIDKVPCTHAYTIRISPCMLPCIALTPPDVLHMI